LLRNQVFIEPKLLTLKQPHPQNRLNVFDNFTFYSRKNEVLRSQCEMDTHAIYIGSYDERFKLLAGCSFIIYNEKLLKPVLQRAFTVNQFQPRCLQPEYEALSAALIDAAKLGLTKLKIFIASELVYLQLNDKRLIDVEGLAENNYRVCQSDYLLIQPLYRQVVRLFRKFSQIKVIGENGVRTFHANTLARIQFNKQNAHCIDLVV